MRLEDDPTVKTPMSPRCRKQLAELVYRANVKLATKANKGA